MAIAGLPSRTDSRAAATVPDRNTSTPRFPPWLIPEQTQSMSACRCDNATTIGRSSVEGELSRPPCNERQVFVCGYLVAAARQRRIGCDDKDLAEL